MATICLKKLFCMSVCILHIVYIGKVHCSALGVMHRPPVFYICFIAIVPVCVVPDKYTNYSVGHKQWINT